jgi:TPP-dependent pyruvate/acetoin dehydrogenase alpha subunit
MAAITEEELREMDEWATAEAKKAVVFADESPLPDDEELYLDVMSDDREVTRG